MNEFEPCFNSPEYIKNLATRILGGEKLYFSEGLRCGKVAFKNNLALEIMRQMEGGQGDT